MTGPIGREAQQPDPALRPPAPLPGEWRTTGTPWEDDLQLTDERIDA